MPATRTASDVRQWVSARPALVAALSPEAQRSLRPRARGVLHRDVVKAYNGKRRKTDRYTPGNSTRVAAERKATRADLVAQGLAGKRGPLPKSLRG